MSYKVCMESCYTIGLIKLVPKHSNHSESEGGGFKVNAVELYWPRLANDNVYSGK